MEVPVSQSSSGPLSTAERLAVSLLAPFATVVVASYVADRIGLRFLPVPMLALAVLSVVAAAAVVRPALRTRTDVALFLAAVLGVFGWLLWLASPTLLPLSTGPDLTHHLILIRFIEEHWRLVHDPSLERYLGEMAQYTPGSHVLSALAGAWSGTDGLRALHTVQAATVALKSGFLLLTGLRLLPRTAPRPLALVGVVLLFASPQYFVRGFTEFGFVAQVVAELFVVAMWWASAAWWQTPSTAPLLVFAMAGSATFLTWPVYVGAPALAGGVLVMAQRRMSVASRVRCLLLAFTPIAVVAALYILGRLGWLQLAGTGGTAPWPSMSAYGPVLVALATLGVLVGLVRTRGLATLVFLASALLQAGAFFILAQRAGAPQPYMALKMGYLLLWPMAACAVLACGAAWDAMASRLGAGGGERRASAVVAWAVVIALGVIVGRPLLRNPRLLHPLPPATSLPLYDAGRWARAHVPAPCVEYLVGDDETAYWLHLAVLGNPRMSPRTGDNRTYEPTDAVVRWLTPGGLPYAIADLPALPRGVRDELDVMQAFGTAAVVRRRGPTSCDPSR